MMRESFRRLFRFPPSEDRVGSDVGHEIAFHVETRTAELVAQGMKPDDARARALAEFGDLHDARMELEAIARRRVRHERRADWWSDLHQDLRYGVRALRRAPLFTLLAIVTLAIGIGANATVFSVLKSVLIDALPYADANALARVFRSFPDRPQAPGPLNAETVAAIDARQQSFERLAAFADLASQAAYDDADGPRTATVVWVEPAFFDTLGVQPTLGRTFVPGEGTNGLAPMTNGRLARDTAEVVVASHGAWQRLLGGDPAAAGREVRLDGVPRIVIGVLPREFVGPTGDRDFYLPMDLQPVIAHPQAGRGMHWLSLVGRLGPGASADTVQQELASIGRDLDSTVPTGSLMLASRPLHDVMVGDTRRPLLALMASAGLVLLLACANLAAALLSRTLSRRKEFAVRLALGAGRGRLVRQLLTESLVLAAAGGAAGLLLATLVLTLVRTLATRALPVHADLALDSGAVLVTSVVALCTGLLFGLAPAFSVRGAGPQAALREEGRGTGESRRARRLRGALVAGQIAVCVWLLAGAGLLARSLWAMTSTPLGFDPGVLAVSLRLPVRDYAAPDAIVQFHDRLLARLRALPGVEAAGSADAAPTVVFTRRAFTIEGAPPSDDNRSLFLYATVTDDYFRTLQIPVQEGRTFDTRDRDGAVQTIVISESAARRYWPAGDALGSRIRLGQEAVVEVVGIVGDVRNDPARSDAEPMGYRSTRQAPSPIASFFVRTQGDPLALLPSVERELAAIDRGIPLEHATTLRAVIGEGLAGRRLPLLLLAAFGAFALLLASVGVYAMFATLVAAREREFGVRLALGSGPRAIAGLVFRQGAGWMGAGLIGGAAGIILVVRVLRDLLYGVPAFDPVALGVAVSTLIACAAIAMLVPLRRAVRLDPAATLRSQ